MSTVGWCPSTYVIDLSAAKTTKYSAIIGKLRLHIVVISSSRQPRDTTHRCASSIYDVQRRILRFSFYVFGNEQRNRDIDIRCAAPNITFFVLRFWSEQRNRDDEL